MKTLDGLWGGVLVLGGVSVSGFASTDLPNEADFFADQPIVLSVSRLAQPVSSAPAAVTVIDREMIKASGFRQIADLLRLVPGMEVTWAGGITPAVTYHGLSSIYSRRMQVLVDGRSVYNPAYGQVHWRSLPVDVDDIERIEVVRGPNAAIDGINAFQGTIHIITRPAADSRGTALGATIGDRRVGDGSARHGLRAGDWDWRIQAMTRGDDRAEDIQDTARENSFSVRGDWRPSGRDEVNVWLGGTRADWQASMIGLPLTNGQTTNHETAFGQVRFRRARDADNEWSIKLEHSETFVDVNFPIPLVNLPPLTPLTTPTDYNHWYKRDALEFDLLARPRDDVRASLALEARRDEAWSRNLLSRESPVQGNIYRLSGSAEWLFAMDWMLHASAMLEHHYYAGTRLSPRLALNWRAAPGHSLRLGVSRAFRSPDFLEQESDLRFTVAPFLLDQVMLSPYALRPETITSWELGYVFQSSARGLRGDARLFRNRVGDIIDLGAPYPVPGELAGDGADITYQNLYKANQVGLDLQLRWQPERETWMVLNQAWSDTESNSAEYANSDPGSVTSLLLAHRFGHEWSASLGYYHVGAMSWVTSYATTPSYDRLDLRLARDWKIDGKRWEAALVLRGVLGGYDEYVNHFYRLEPGAQFTLRVGWN